MKPFILKDSVDKEKVFVINLFDIQGRLDPYYYKTSFQKLKRTLVEKNFIPVHRIIKSWNRGDGPRDGFYTTDRDNGVYFLRVNNLKKHTVDLTDIKFINRQIHEKKLKRAQVKPGDVVFAISGTKNNLGTVSIIPDYVKEANLNSAIVRLDLDSSMINKNFFCFLFDLNFVRTQIDFIGKGAAQNNINNEEIGQIYIPNISLEKQKEFVSFLNNSLLVKKKKDAQAKQLLTNIDEYLLKELGITLPERDNSLENRIFKTSLSKVSGGRIDCDYYSEYYIDIEDSIENSIYPTNNISSVVSQISSGKTPASNEYSDEETEYPIIKVGSYSAEFIDLNKVDYTKSENKTSAHKGDIFILSAAHQAEYVGRHIKFLQEEPEVPTTYVGELICIRAINSLCNSIYLFSLLSLEIFKTLINRKKTGQTSHIYGKDIKHINIPLPPIEKQNEIAEHIKQIRDQAKQLQEEAKCIYEQAKQKVDRLILGEVNV